MAKTDITDEQKIKIMAETVKPIIQLLQTRLKTRRDTLDALSSQTLDSIPESIKKIREEESSKIRAVVQEQEDLIATINALYPNG
jgi:gas vesicle protein